MIKTKTQKATWEQHLAVATVLSKKGLRANQTVEWFKPRKYTLKSLHYEASRVGAMIAGRESVTLDDMITALNAKLKDGTLKYTKAKGIHIPKGA